MLSGDDPNHPWVCSPSVYGVPDSPRPTPMSIARSLLLRASRSARIAGIFRSHAFARRAVRRFMPGEDVGAALDATGSLAASDLSAVITALGERVTSPSEVERVV